MPNMGVRNETSVKAPHLPLDAPITEAKGSLGRRDPDVSADGFEAPRASGQPERAASPRRTVGQRLSTMSRALFKGAAVLGLAAGLLVGGQFLLKNSQPPAPAQNVEQTVIPGGVHDPSLPGGQGPPAVEVDAPPGTHHAPTLPGGTVTETNPPQAPGRMPQPGGTGGTLTLDPGIQIKPSIPLDGGQRLQDVLRPQIEAPAGTVQSTVPGGVDLTTDATKPTLQRTGPTDSVQVDLTTDPTKPTLQRSDDLRPVQLDTTRLPSFRPHQLRGQ